MTQPSTVPTLRDRLAGLVRAADRHALWAFNTPHELSSRER